MFQTLTGNKYGQYISYKSHATKYAFVRKQEVRCTIFMLLYFYQLNMCYYYFLYG